MEHQFQLPENHHWKALPGCQVLVIDRGALRLDYPQGWHVSTGDGSIRVQDAEPPDDECTLQVSVRRVAGLVPDSVPMHDVLAGALPDVEEPRFHERRGHNYRLLWTGNAFTDPIAHRPAWSCTALVLAPNLHALLTYVYWEEDRARVGGVWDTVLQSLQMGLHIPNPLTGRAVDPSAQ